MKIYFHVIWKILAKSASIIATLIILIFVISIGTYLRTRAVSSLENKYLLGADSYRHMRHIKQIAEEGDLPKVDPMRNVPLGHKNRSDSKAFPWFIVQSFKLLKKFFPNLVLRQVAIFYPVITTMVILAIFFLLGRQLFDNLVALLATIALAVSPYVIQRTHAGYVDTDAIIILLFVITAYLYSLYLQSDRFYKKAIGNLAWSLALGVLAILWRGVSIAVVIFYGCDFLLTLYRKTHWKESIVSIIGIFLYLGIVLFATDIYREEVLSPFSLSAVALPVVVMLSHIAIHLTRYIKYREKLYKYRKLLYTGMITSILLIVVCVYLSKIEILESLFEHMLYPFGKDPIMLNVQELQHFDASKWWTNYGLLFPFGLLGFYFLFYRVWHEAKEHLRNPSTHLISLSVGVFIMVIFRAFTSFFSHQSLAISVLFLLIPAVWVIIQTSYIIARSRKQYLLIVLVWFLVCFNLACSAMRFNLFFAPILALTSSFVLARLFEIFMPNVQKISWIYSISLLACMLLFFNLDWLTFLLKIISPSSTIQLSARTRLLLTLIPSLILIGFILDRFIIDVDKFYKKILKCCGFFIIFLLSLLAYTGVCELGVGQRGLAAGFFTKPTPILPIRKAVEWLKEETSSEAVVAATWDHGSVLNELGQRATIIDDEQNIPWIRSFYKRIFLGTKNDEALSFLKEHQATHLMLALHEVASLDIIWTLAYPNQSPDEDLIILLKPTVLEKQIEFAVSKNSLEQNLLFNKHYNSLEISKITLDYLWKEDSFYVSEPPKAVLKIDKELREVKIRELIIGNQQWYFPEGELDVTLWLPCYMEKLQFAKIINIMSAMIITKQARDFLSIRLFLGDSCDEHFKLVYSGRDGYVKIWEIRP